MRLARAGLELDHDRAASFLPVMSTAPGPVPGSPDDDQARRPAMADLYGIALWIIVVAEIRTACGSRPPLRSADSYALYRVCAALSSGGCRVPR